MREARLRYLWSSSQQQQQAGAPALSRVLLHGLDQLLAGQDGKTATINTGMSEGVDPPSRDSTPVTALAQPSRTPPSRSDTTLWYHCDVIGITPIVYSPCSWI